MKSVFPGIAKPACLALAAAFVLPHTAAFAGNAERAIEYRQGFMNILNFNAKAMGEMLKGERPFEQAAFAAHAGDLARATQLNLLGAFPEDSDSGETDAMAEVWMEPDDFKQKFSDLQAAAKSLDKAATGGDKAAIGSAYKDLGQACKSCHKKFKN